MNTQNPMFLSLIDAKYIDAKHIDCVTWGMLEHCPEALFTKLLTIIVDETDGVANTVDVVDIIDDRGGRDISMTSSKLS